MSHVPVSSCGRLPDLTNLALSGADALSFAQRICANDVAALAIGGWQWNCLLSPQGRVLHLFRLWRVADGLLRLVLPAGAADGALETLARYRLRAKVSIERDARPLVGGVHGEVPSTVVAMRSSDGRWIGIHDVESPATAELPDLSADWRARDLAQGVPWLGSEITESFTPQALSLGRLSAFSVRKGCYPGQEIVARMHFLGESKRELRRFRCARSVPAGVRLETAGAAARAIGTVVMVETGVAGCELLAVVQRETGDAPTSAATVDGLALEPLPLDAPPLPP